VVNAPNTLDKKRKNPKKIQNLKNTKK
jgi:hypothetical protein